MHDKNTFKAGHYKTQLPNGAASYKSFQPNSINHEFLFSDPQIYLLAEESMRALGELNAFSTLVPDVDYFIQMHVAKEATTSSKIEGTRTEIDEVLTPDEDIEPEKKDDWQEVKNYINAMNFAIEELSHLPLSMRLLKETHGILLNSVRGKHKQPGGLRKSQNWIGGANIATASFVPPHHTEVPELMGDLEKYWHNDRVAMSFLVKVAISHYQFETIHPFLDGNGRIGRLLITLQLVDKGILQKPTLYLSDFLQRHRTAYYDALSMVRSSDNIEHWIRFFLTGVLETARKGVETFKKIVELRKQYETTIMLFGKGAPAAQRLLLYLFSHPIVDIAEVASYLDITVQGASKIVHKLVDHQVLIEKTGKSRNRRFALQEYIDLFR